MRSYFVVAALTAVKVSAESNGASHYEDNAYVYAQSPIYHDAFVAPLTDYTHPGHAHNAHAVEAPHHVYADGAHYSDSHSPHYETRYVTVPVDEYHPRYIEVPQTPHVVEYPEHRGYTGIHEP